MDYNPTIQFWCIIIIEINALRIIEFPHKLEVRFSTRKPELFL